VKYDTTEVDFDVTPVADFTYTNVSSRSFIEFGKGLSEGDDYLWEFGDGNGATVEEPKHYYTSGGSYTVTLIVTSGCGADTTSQTIIVNGTGIDDPESVTSVNVFPNPASELVHFNIESKAVTTWTVQLMNLQGQTLEMQKLSSGSNASGDISLKDIPAGYYLIELNSELGRVIRPLVVQ